MWGRLVTRAVHRFWPCSAQPGADTERTGGHGHHSDIADFAAARLWRCRFGSADVDSRWHAAVRERLTMADYPGLRRGSIRYELRVQGHLDQHWSSWFTGLTLTHKPGRARPRCAERWQTRPNYTANEATAESGQREAAIEADAPTANTRHPPHGQRHDRHHVHTHRDRSRPSEPVGP